MSTLQVITEINKQHLLNVGIQFQLDHDAKKAKESVAEGLKKLYALKLTGEDRRHTSLIIKAFRYMRDSFHALETGKYDKGVRLSQKAQIHSEKYEALMRRLHE